ncbi:MAG: hypothetical protein ACYDG3_11840 [Bacillati bacterium]
MKTETELVCTYHLGDYQMSEMVKRNKTPIDISLLSKPIDGLCDKVRDRNIAKVFPEYHTEFIVAVTWEV